MKSNTFNYSLLAVGVAALMGVSTGAMAATNSGSVSTGAQPINNQATAIYTVNNVEQPKVESNKVTVNITETANFSLIATLNDTAAGGTIDDDKNEDVTATPEGTSVFEHTLQNNGNVNDTYTLNITDNNNAGIVTDDQDYPLNNNSDITYTLRAVGGDPLSTEQRNALTALGQAESGTISSGSTIQLPPGVEAALSYSTTTPATADGGNTGVGTLEATSSFITTAGGNATLINENQTLVKLPVFAITKTAACQGSNTCDSLNLNAANTDITYSLNVENVRTNYSADATNVVFRDVLPEGMTLIDNTVTVGGQTVPSNQYTVTTVAGRQVLQGTLPELKVGESLTVEFQVSVDKDTLSEAGSATNDLTLYDNYDDTTPNPDGDFDISDSTDDTTDAPKVPDDGPNTDGEDTSSTINFTDRQLTIEDNDAKEIAVSGDEVTYTQTITNGGNATEGGTDRPINITITDPDGNALNVTNPVYVDASGAEQPLEVVNAENGEYKLPESVTIAPTESLNIRYTVQSNGQSEGPIGSNTNDIGYSEDNVVTLTPGGTDAPASDSVTNTTTIEGVELIKTQYLDVGCTGTVSGPFTDQDIDGGTPEDCIVYRITADNTFSNLNVTNLIISDAISEFSAGATYNGDATSSVSSSNSSISSAASSNGTIITTTVGTLTPTDTATLQFSVDINE